MLNALYAIPVSTMDEVIATEGLKVFLNMSTPLFFKSNCLLLILSPLIAL